VTRLQHFSLPLDFGHELVVDLFAGGGGASLGIARAYRHPDVAVNHNPIAIGVHQANHPDTLHYTCDVFEVDPVAATGGRPVGVLWASPDCRHHSKAKGGKPRSKKIRGLAWVVIRWAAACKPRVICLENVEEFADWGPLDGDGKPCRLRKGATFRRWKGQLEKLGYRVEHKELVAADYGAPTIRKRLYVVARCDGQPIVWPAPTHAKKPTSKLLPWRSAAECIDFTLPAKSIFGRTKPLADNTQRRIAKGLWRYVLNCPRPFIVPLRGTSPSHTATHDLDEPLSTVTGGGTHHALVTPFLTEHANASNQRVFPADEPLRTQVAQVKGGHFALVAPTLVQTGYGEREGQAPRALDLQAPLGTVVAGGVKHALVAAHITKFRANSVGTDLHDPMHTITAGGDMVRPAGAAHAMGLVSAFMSQASGGPNGHISYGHPITAPVSTVTGTGSHQQLVNAYLVKYYGEGGQWQACDEPMHTVPTKDRMGLVQTVQVSASIVAPDLLERARACAAFLHRWLPEHFPEPADLVLLGDFVLVDISLRMLAPKELACAQGFPTTYKLTHTAAGKPVTKTDQVRLIGNSVCPDVAEAIVRGQVAGLVKLYAAAA
jgi:DNA (cytosine-5)-methyltransferase 1